MILRCWAATGACIHAACQAIRKLPVPVVARLHGAVIGAGLELAASCDLRIAAEGTKFSMPEVRLGRACRRARRRRRSRARSEKPARRRSRGAQGGEVAPLGRFAVLSNWLSSWRPYTCLLSDLSKRRQSWPNCSTRSRLATRSPSRDAESR
ncbi:MAG: enoyl-CoA hydratase/isomerase family protein [Betaproteobacteria bacterium]|nr:MAG: enoyl-CoA hydratase/isomerase family protein [Betaproteobacteria bacterium]